MAHFNSIFDFPTQKSSIFWSKSKVLRKNLRNFDSSSSALDDHSDCVVCFATPNHHSVTFKTGTGTAESPLDSQKTLRNM